MNRLREIYEKEIVKSLMAESGYTNLMEVPSLRKIVVNSGVGEATTNSSAIEEVVEILTLITGQKPMVAKSRKAISTFKLREGVDIGVYTTLRGVKMWEFFDKLVNVVIPRTKDFRGYSVSAFDGSGNYSIGIQEHTVFPEIDPNKVQKLRTLQVTIVTSARDDKQAKQLLDKFGFPFKKDGKEI